VADEKDDDVELIPIVEGEEPEKPEVPEKPAEGEEPEVPEKAAEGDEEEDEDERLGDDHEDDGDADASASTNRRRKRREAARIKRDEAKRELEMLRWQNQELARRLGAVEGATLQQNEAELERRYAQTQADLAQAEQIYAKAITDGQGDYAAQAMRIRDAAKAEGERIAGAYNQLKQARTAPQPDARVVNHAAEWVRDNPWYDPQGKDDVSRLAKQIDSTLAAEGFNPASRAYWEELTSRVTKALEPAGGKTPASGGGTPAPSPRGAPPMGGSSQHAPVSTRKNEIRVTPERKAAMVEAGIWDDPVRRQRVLREYQAFDKASAR